MSTIGQRVRHARSFRGLTPEQLDKATGLPAGTTTRIETVQRASKRDAEAYAKLAAALDVRGAWLQRDESDQAKVTADDCMRLVPHVLGEAYGRPAVLLAGPEMFADNVVGLGHHVREVARVLGQGWSRRRSPPPVASSGSCPTRATRLIGTPCGFGEQHVGHMPRERAGAWQPIVAAFQRHYGRYVACFAEIYQVDDSPEPRYRMALCMPVSLQILFL